MNASDKDLPVAEGYTSYPHDFKLKVTWIPGRPFWSLIEMSIHFPAMTASLSIPTANQHSK